MDALFDILCGMRLTGGVFLEAEFSAPWRIAAKIGPEDCAPFAPVPRNIIAYHYVTAGRLLLDVDSQPPVAVEGGEIVVLPRNDDHRLGSDLNLPPISADRLIQPSPDGGLARIVHGGGGERTLVLCGFLGSDTPNDPVIGLLPQVLKLDVREGASGQWIETSFRFAAQQLAAGHAQSPAVLARLAELLFVEAVRRYLSSLAPEQGGWLAGLRDPVVGRALALLHGQTDRRWTAEELARASGLSRSAFAERFTAVMGEPPMRYLATWRLQRAAQQLAETHEPVGRIAFAYGYESEAAFNRAFKRAFGTPPAAWRKERRKPTGARDG